MDSPPSIPDFSLLRRIGRGSYGDVWLARSVTGVYRAVKVVYRARFDDERPYEREFAGIRQFEPISVGQETQVSLLHVGRNDAQAFFYYVMELADDAETGEEIIPEYYVPKTLKEMRSRRTCLPAAECVSIGVALTRALAHLHRYGLVHRDIKPSNVIFVHGVPKLADIGLVSVVDTSASFVGTEGFVPPEGPGSVQADLYSLGKVIYEISTGRDRKDFPKLPDDIDALPDARALLELNEVTLKACDSELRRRYSSADAMHDDLVLLQAGKSVKRLHLIERRFQMAAKYGIAATVLTVATAAAFLWATHQARAAKRLRIAAEQALHESQLNQARAQRMTDLAGRRFDTLALLRKSAAATGNRLDLRNEAIACLALPDLRPMKRWWKTPQWDSWRFDLQLQRYLTNDALGNITIRDIETDRQLAFLPTEGRPLSGMIWSPDGQLIATTDKGGKTGVWHLETQRLIAVDFPKDATLACFTPDSQTLVVRHKDQSLHFLNVFSGTDENTLKGLSGIGPFFNPAGTAFCTLATTQAIIYARADGNVLATLEHPESVHSAAWHPDGRRLVTGCRNAIHFWDVMTGREIGMAAGHDSIVISLAFDATGELLASGSWDNTTRFWQADVHRELVQAARCGNGLQISPDARRLAFRSWDHSRVELWEVAGGREARRFQVPSLRRQSYDAGFSPDGRLLYLDNADGVYFFDLASSKSVGVIGATGSEKAAFHPSGKSFITCGDQGLRLWPFEIDQATATLRFGPAQSLGVPGTRGVNGFSITPDGEALVAVTDDGFRVLNPMRPERVVRPEPGTRPRSTPAISVDGRWVAMGKRDNRLRICDAHTGKTVTNLNVAGDCAALFSPDNRWLLSATPAEFRLFAIDSWKPGLRIPRVSPYSAGPCAAFTHDGKILALAVAEHAVRLVVAGTVQELATVSVGRLLSQVRFSPDDTQLLINYESGFAQVWDLRLIRQELAEMNLDWDQPPFPPPTATSPDSQRFTRLTAPLTAQQAIAPVAAR